MESRIRIIQWLRLLLLPAGVAGWTRRARQDIWFRRCEMPPGKIKFKVKNTNRIRQLNNKLMESRLRILRWLSLLLLSAGLVGWSDRVALKALYSRPYLKQDHTKKYRLQNLKQILQTFNKAMKIQLKMLRWLSLLLLSEGLRWQLQNLAHFSWFRQP